MRDQKNRSGVIRVKRKFLIEMLLKAEESDSKVRLMQVYSDTGDDDGIVIEIIDRTRR